MTGDVERMPISVSRWEFIYENRPQIDFFGCATESLVSFQTCNIRACMSSPTEMEFEFRYLITSMLPAGTCDMLIYIFTYILYIFKCVSLASLSCVCGCVGSCD